MLFECKKVSLKVSLFSYLQKLRILENARQGVRGEIKKIKIKILTQVNLFQKHLHILASTNPQCDKRLFIELQVQYMKIASSEHVVYINCSECQNKKQFVYTTCSGYVLSLQFSCMN